MTALMNLTTLLRRPSARALLAIGLPPGRAELALVLFNLGVELGQLLALARVSAAFAEPKTRLLVAGAEAEVLAEPV